MSNQFYMPSVLVEDANGIHSLSTKSLLLKQRVIHLDCPITGDVVNEVIRTIFLLSMDNTSPITVIIDSPGGEIQAGLSLIDAFEACPCIVQTVTLGSACSMGAVLLGAGSPGHRFVSAKSKVMIHEPLLGQGVSGSTSQMESIVNNLKERRETINNLLCKYTGQDEETMREATSYDHYFSSEEAVSFGLADSVVEGKALFSAIMGGENE